MLKGWKLRVFSGREPSWKRNNSPENAALIRTFLSKEDKFEKKKLQREFWIFISALQISRVVFCLRPWNRNLIIAFELEIDDFEGRTHARKLVTVDQFSRLRIPRGRAFVGSQTDCSHLLSIWLARKWFVAAWNLRSINDKLVWHSPLISLVAASTCRQVNLSTLRLVCWSFLRWSGRNSRV